MKAGREELVDPLDAEAAAMASRAARVRPEAVLGRMRMVGMRDSTTSTGLFRAVEPRR